jgi:hypothetical protein
MKPIIIYTSITILTKETKFYADEDTFFKEISFSVSQSDDLKLEMKLQ